MRQCDWRNYVILYLWYILSCKTFFMFWTIYIAIMHIWYMYWTSMFTIDLSSILYICKQFSQLGGGGNIFWGLPHPPSIFFCVRHYWRVPAVSISSLHWRCPQLLMYGHPSCMSIAMLHYHLCVQTARSVDCIDLLLHDLEAGLELLQHEDDQPQATFVSLTPIMDRWVRRR
jgi:hypothetical protein